jgi:hypothetical protein
LGMNFVPQSMTKQYQWKQSLPFTTME